MILKLANKADMDEVLDEFENVSIKLFVFRVTPTWQKRLFSTFNFGQIFLNLSYKMGFETWWSVRPWDNTAHIVLKLKYIKYNRVMAMLRVVSSQLVNAEGTE